MRKILIDCDPGHDDALAILCALANKEKLEILGVTTVGGNQTLEKVTANAQNILAFAQAEVPLVKGQSQPLVKTFEPSDEAHGKSGMDGPYFENLVYPITDENAVLFMAEKIQASKEKVTLVALGPLTNIALLLKTFPEIHNQIEAISLMGGGIRNGNVTSLAEFNIYVDPEAAHIVYHSGLPIIMSGLDVTEQAEIKVEEIELLQNKGKFSHLAYELLSFYNKSGRQFGFVNSPIHDLCAVAYLLKAEIFAGHHYFVDVNTSEGIGRGQTFADKRLVSPHKANVLVLENVERKHFVELLLSALERLDSEVI